MMNDNSWEQWYSGDGETEEFDRWRQERFSSKPLETKEKPVKSWCEHLYNNSKFKWEKHEHKQWTRGIKTESNKENQTIYGKISRQKVYPSLLRRVWSFPLLNSQYKKPKLVPPINMNNFKLFVIKRYHGKDRSRYMKF